MAKHLLYRSLYRACLREVRAWKPLPFLASKSGFDKDFVIVTDPVFSDKSGNGGFTATKNTVFERLQRWSSVREEFQLEQIKSWLKRENIDEKNPKIPTKQLCRLIRMEFEFATTENVDRGFAALQIIRELLQSSFCTSISNSNNIRVEVTTHKHDLSDDKRRIFLYRVRMQNTAAPKVTLKGRGFHFANIDNGEVKSVHEVKKYQPGVVGLFPELEPGGACFEYQSWVDMETADAFMEGCYEFQNDENNELFEVDIGRTQMRDFSVQKSN